MYRKFVSCTLLIVYCSQYFQSTSSFTSAVPLPYWRPYYSRTILKCFPGIGRSRNNFYFVKFGKETGESSWLLETLYSFRASEVTLRRQIAHW